MMKTLCVVIVLLFVSISLAESRIPEYMPEPKFFAGCPVLWADGSKGIIVERLEYDGTEWHYIVYLPKADMSWRLGENGLRYND